MVKTDAHIMDITLDDLHANYRKKPCQAGCGVYCAVSTSLLVANPARVIGNEIVARAKRVPALMRNAFDSRLPAALRNEAGSHKVNRSRDGSPPTEAPETLVGDPQR